ncbi:hypothetical protein C2G38_2158031 [Gigaspora rosea]|uniref:Dilute domain-containing protein n=1 Tax=Gigaspora rosea TaxID=44941 RepID=A0A397W510_9GLOM|nr:hypothetical protein C2G38_2158031 [Gigaspora rosea]
MTWIIFLIQILIINMNAFRQQVKNLETGTKVKNFINNIENEWQEDKLPEVTEQEFQILKGINIL